MGLTFLVPEFPNYHRGRDASRFQCRNPRNASGKPKLEIGVDFICRSAGPNGCAKPPRHQTETPKDSVCPGLQVSPEGEEYSAAPKGQDIPAQAEGRVSRLLHAPSPERAIYETSWPAPPRSCPSMGKAIAATVRAPLQGLPMWAQEEIAVWGNTYFALSGLGGENWGGSEPRPLAGLG